VPELGATVVEAVVDLSSNAPAILNWHQVTPAGSVAASNGLTWLAALQRSSARCWPDSQADARCGACGCLVSLCGACGRQTAL